jgi:hypothetical protein
MALHLNEALIEYIIDSDSLSNLRIVIRGEPFQTKVEERGFCLERRRIGMSGFFIVKCRTFVEN